MDLRTVRALARINRDFYLAVAQEFSRSRHSPWPGWGTLRPAALQSLRAGTGSVLDAGCGNGRFGSWLAGAAQAAGVPIGRYVGIDGCPPLLREARRGSAAFASSQYLLQDLVETSPGAALRGQRFDLVAAFGLLHHVPSRERRRALVEELWSCVAPTGLLAMTSWRFLHRERFRGKVVPWNHPLAGDRPLDPEALEEGDALLGWGSPIRAVRYCHELSDAEIEEFADHLEGAERRLDFLADGHGGQLNRYLVLGRAGPGRVSHPARQKGPGAPG